MMRTPVALLIFNRPDTTQRVFEAVAAARPPVLLVVADGPRAGRAGEQALCEQARAVAARVDWPCDVRTNFATQNFGCRQRIASGLDWVFSQVEEAVVLEDDCLPDPAFFQLCDELLPRYRDQPTVMMISGDNFLPERPFAHSYYFSRYPHIWGWATWRRAWHLYDVQMNSWPAQRDAGWCEANFASRREAEHWRSVFEAAHAGVIDTWDYQWTYACFVSGGLAVTPAANLVTNIGFGAGATHTARADDMLQVATRTLDFPLRHPAAVARDAAADAEEFSRLHGRRTLWQRMRRSLGRRLTELRTLTGGAA